MKGVNPESRAETAKLKYRDRSRATVPNEGLNPRSQAYGA
jgi:hypothetical protein